ncbi:MAG: D-sedoheptulose 7-phosphate isomerase [Desulfobacterales bacterium]|nr:D-sedoheptulose 7-phosphate isomerase [Desulfobacterales bacterium]
MFEQALNAHLKCFQSISAMAGIILDAGRKLAETLENGRRILVCGNGGSAADAQHFAAEIVGRFEKERRAWPAVALTTDTSILTAIANDYSYDDIFARQIEGLGSSGDALIGISTSGNSKNIIKAVEKAKQIHMETILLLGKDGGMLMTTADNIIVVPSISTARIQEVHAFILHVWAEFIEETLTSEIKHL